MKEPVQETFDQNYLGNDLLTWRGGVMFFFFFKYSDSQCCWKKYSENVTIEELDKAIIKLNRGTSSDIFGVTAECILYCGDKLKKPVIETD